MNQVQKGLAERIDKQFLSVPEFIISTRLEDEEINDCLNTDGTLIEEIIIDLEIQSGFKVYRTEFDPPSKSIIVTYLG